MHRLRAQTAAPVGQERFLEEAKGKPFTKNQRFSPSVAVRRFERELACYRADGPHITVEKCAERCLKLSALLTAAVPGR